MQNSDRSYANRIRRLKGKIYASGTPYLSPTAKSAENMLVRIESQNPLRTLTPAGSVVEVSCCGGDAPVTTYSAIVYSANPDATPTDDKCMPFTTLEGSGASDTYVVRYDDNGEARWAARIGGSLNDNGLVVSSFGADSCAVAGIFTSPVLTFYNATDGSPGDTLTNTGGRCIFLAVYDGTGVVQRVYRVSDIGPEVYKFGMTTSATGDIYLAGAFTTSAITFTNALDVDADTINNLNSFFKGFLTKYPSDGSVAWVVPIEAPGASGLVNCEAVITDGSSVYVTGSYNADATFQATGSASPVQLTYSGADEGVNTFLVRYLDTGVPQWAARIGGTTTANIVSGRAIVATNNTVYVGGVFNNTIKVESAGGSLFKTLDSNGGSGFFIAKYNDVGAVQWATRITSSKPFITGEQLSIIRFMSVNGTNLYIAGGVVDSTIICYDSNDNIADTSTPTNTLSGYLISYDTDGMFQFRRYMYGNNVTDNTSGSGVAALSGDVYTCGNYTASPLKIENGSGPGYVELTKGGNFDGHILKYDDTGNLIWRTRVGGADFQDATGIATCASGTGCFVVGNYGNGLA
jgi:hypothetical protein